MHPFPFSGRTSESALVYKYTVVGSDKASIDTGVDLPSAGDNDWTGGDVLDFYFYGRTDEAVFLSSVDLFFNNDTATNYEVERVRGAGTSVIGTVNSARAGILLLVPGASSTASFFVVITASLPNYAGTVGFKSATIHGAVADNPATSAEQAMYAAAWKSTAAITRLKLAPNTGGQKFKVGSQLLIYKRLAPRL